MSTMTPSSPDPSRPFYAIDDPEHPAPRDGTTVFGKLMFQDVPATFRVHFKNGAWRLPDGISIVHPVEWRPIPSTPPPAPSATPRKWNTEYHRELDYSERLAKEYEANGDTHGMNFHQGRSSALISVDIMAGQIFDTLEQDLSAALARAEQAEVERDRFKAMYLAEWTENEALLAKAGVDFTPNEDGGKPISQAIEEIVGQRDALQRHLAEAKALNRKLRNEIRVLWQRLRDANRGAQCNAKVNWGLAKDCATLRAQLSAALAAKAEAETALAAWSAAK